MISILSWSYTRFTQNQKLILLSGYVYCREEMKAAVGVVSPSGFVWWNDADFRIPSYANLLLEHTYLFISECMTVFKCD